MSLEKVIFSIDKVHDIGVLYKFLKYLSGLNAMSQLKMQPVQMIGGYESSLELSWMVTALDFEQYIRHTDWVRNQESFLYVPGDVRQSCALHFRNGHVVPLSPMKNVPAQETWGGFSYRMDEGSYWVC